MTIETFDPNSDTSSNTPASEKGEVTVTEAAIQHIANMLSNSDALGVRLGVKKSGCSGFKYDIEFVNAQEDSTDQDSIIEIQDNLKLYIAADHLDKFRGMEIDYTTEGLNSSIKFNNPNARDLCGCGESFNI